MYFKNNYFRLMPGVLFVCLFLTGCSSNVSVTGMVTYSDTGEPVQGGVIVFTGDNDVIGRAAIRNGRYSIGVVNDGDGIPPGTYTVSADRAAIASMGGMSMGLDMFGNPLSPAEGGVGEPVERYHTKEPPTIEVTRSMTFDLVVERGPRP